MSSFEICTFEEFVAEATPQSGSLEEAASTQEILIQQIEGYLARLKVALCTDVQTLEDLTGGHRFQTSFSGENAGSGRTAVNVMDTAAIGFGLNTEMGITIARAVSTGNVAVKFRRDAGAAPGSWTLRLFKNDIEVATFTVATT